MNVSLGICASFQPKVTWMFDGKTYASKVTALNRHNFTFTGKIPVTLVACERRELRYFVEGRGGNLSEIFMVIQKCRLLICY